MHRIVMTLALVLTVLSGSVIAQDRLKEELAGWQLLDIVGWTAMIKRDPFTDEFLSGFASAEDIAVMCDPDRETYSTGLHVSLSSLPKLNANPADVEFRIGKQNPQAGKWESTTGPGGSAITVPDKLVADVLRSGRLAVRVHGHTRVFGWSNGDAVYAVMRECAGF